MATKFVYSEQDIKEITAKYAAGTTLEALAEQYAKSVASVRMKLVKLGVYQKAATSTPSASAAKSENLSVYKQCLADVGVAPF
jgi:hypothetical protein